MSLRNFNDLGIGDNQKEFLETLQRIPNGWNIFKLKLAQMNKHTPTFYWLDINFVP